MFFHGGTRFLGGAQRRRAGGDHVAGFDEMLGIDRQTTAKYFGHVVVHECPDTNDSDIITALTG